MHRGPCHLFHPPHSREPDGARGIAQDGGRQATCSGSLFGVDTRGTQVWGFPKLGANPQSCQFFVVPSKNILKMEATEEPDSSTIAVVS